MTDRRQFFATVIGTLITAPLVRLGLIPGKGWGSGEALDNPTFATHGGKIGDTLVIRRPMRYHVQSGPA
jgi:hypothetical protein